MNLILLFSLFPKQSNRAILSTEQTEEVDQNDTVRHTAHMRRRSTSRTTSLTSVSTAAQDNEKIKLDGGNAEEFKQLLNKANKVSKSQFGTTKKISLLIKLLI